MKPNRCWIEIIMLGTAIACAIALLIATLGAAAGAAVGALGQKPANPATAAQTFEGVVTCSRCGARHSTQLGRTAGDCTRVCVHGGATFELVDGEKTYLLDGSPEVMKRAAGQRSLIVGFVTGNRIRVSLVKNGR
jgi:hypothetical protein